MMKTKLEIDILIRKTNPKKTIN